MRIQHNITAMNAYRNYSNNTSALAKNLEKLSSGYKINRAGDDAAGLAISEKMRAQISGLEQAQNNAKSGINLVQTAEGALTEVHDMLNRMFTLAEQSANGTYDNDVDRVQLQKEVNQLRDEINRIADSSNFNGIKLLDGSLDTKAVVSGAANISVTPIKDGQLGKQPQAGVFELDLTNFSVSGGKAGITPTISLFGQKAVTLTAVAKDATKDGDAMAADIASKWNTAMKSTTVNGAIITAEAKGSKVTFTMDKAPTEKWGKDLTTAEMYGVLDSENNNQATMLQVRTLVEPVDSGSSRQYAQGSFDLTSAAVDDGKTLTIGDSTYVFAVGANSKYKDLENAIDLTDFKKSDIAANMNIVGMRLTKAAAGNEQFKVGTDTITADSLTVYLTEKEGGVDYAKYDLQGTDNVDGSDEDGKWAGLVKKGTYDTANSTNGLTLQIGDTADKFNKLTVSVKDMHADAMGIGDIDISTQEGASAAMKAIKDAINYVSDVRGGLGATQNRLDHTINNLSVMQENIQDAESTIRDVDVAKEMMEYTKNNILVQSAQAMLAQANQLPQGVLQLLG